MIFSASAGDIGGVGCVWVGRVKEKNRLCVLQPKRKQGRGNFHTVTRPAFIQWQLVPPSGEAAKGAKQNRLHLWPCQVCEWASGPRSVDKLREANHNFTLWFVKSRSSTGGAETQLFSPLNLTARRITARQGVFLLFHPSLFERGFTFFAQEKQPNGDAFYLERNAKSRKWFWPQGEKNSTVWNKLSSPYAHVNVEDKKKKKCGHRASSANCRCEEAETKATLALMASLVIKRPLMYVLNRLFYLLLPLCL